MPSECYENCPFSVLESQMLGTLVLGADIGGMGSVMNVKSEGNILHWNIQKPDGEEITIDVNRNNSNKY